MSFTAEYSLWFTLVCIALAGAGAWFLYRYFPIESDGAYRKPINIGLATFRFITLFIISFLLLGPLMQWMVTRTEKPVVVIALDGSLSILTNKDSATYRTNFVKQLETLQQNLADDYDVQAFTFGNSIEQGLNANFNQRKTNIAALLTEVKSNYSGQNLGAVVVASDGIYNEGNNPVYQAQELRAPIFTLALGDTIPQKDVLIKQVKYNQIVYAGNIFPLQVDISAIGYAGKQTTLTVTHKGNKVFTQSISIQRNDFFVTLPVSLESKEPGTQHYTITLSALQNEISTANNRFDVFINVIDGKQKIALVSLAPHPDIAAYKNSLEQNENYAIQSFSHTEISATRLADYSLIIFHQLPGTRGEGSALIKAANDKQLPRLYVLGALTGIAQLNAAEPFLNVNAARAGASEVTPIIESGFSLFTLSSDEAEHIRKYPPLFAPYGTYRTGGEIEVLMKQQIGNVRTEFPLVFFAKGNTKVGYICGEGFWRWRLHDAAISSQQTTSNLVGKMVQYLAVKNDRSRFRITGAKQFDENQHVKLDAEVYNESFELIQTGEVQIVIQNEAGKKFNYTFSKTEKAYTLDAGILSIGNYSYEAITTVGNKPEKVKGRFAVIPLQVEYLQTTANHQLLNEMAAQSGGSLYYPSQIDALEKSIRESETIKPTRYTQPEVKSWINLKWIFFTILALLSVEWFVRKWNGTV